MLLEAALLDLHTVAGPSQWHYHCVHKWSKTMDEPEIRRWAQILDPPELWDNPSFYLGGGVHASTLECVHINLYVGASDVQVEIRGQPQVLLLRSHHLVLLLIGPEVANWARLAKSQGSTEFHLPTAGITRLYLHILLGFTLLPVNFNSLLNGGINFCSPAKVGKRSQKAE